MISLSNTLDKTGSMEMGHCRIIYFGNGTYSGRFPLCWKHGKSNALIDYICEW